MRRCGRAGQKPVAALQGPLDIAHRPLVQADFDERAHHDSNLVAQKSVAFELKVHLTAVCFPHGCCLQGAHGRVRGAAGSPEAAEVVSPHQRSDGLLHRRHVERGFQMPNQPQTKRHGGTRFSKRYRYRFRLVQPRGLNPAGMGTTSKHTMSLGV